jgi:hypothetical protein
MPHTDNVVRIVSAPCSSGKTYSTCQHLAQQRTRCNWLYVAPSIKLLSQTKLDLERHGLKPTLITSETHKHHVVAAIMRHIACSEESGTVLLITWQSYQHLPFFENRQNWRVIIDEVPQVDSFYAIDLRQHMDELTQYVQLGESVNETLATVIPVDPDMLKRHLSRPDDLTKTVYSFLNDVLTPCRDVFVDLKTWTDFSERRSYGKKGSCTRIYFLSMLNPKLFEGNTLLGANIEDSLLYQWLSNYHDVQFKRNHQIYKNLRFTEHPPETGERLRINYLLKGRGFSKYLAGKELGKGGRTWMDGMDKAALDYIGDRKFLYAINNDYTGQLRGHPNGTQIPVISHGLNEYMNYNLIYFPVALNRAPRHLSMLNQLGLDDEMVKDSTIHEVIYQALMRTSLRDPNSKQVIECIVPEYAAAERLARAFGTVQMKWIGDPEFEKKQVATGRQLHRQANAEKRLCRVLPHFEEIPLTSKELRDNVAEWDARSAPLYAVTFHPTIYDTDAEMFKLDYFEPNEFVREMRSLSKEVIEDKTSNFMINSTVFVKRNADDEGFRKKVNFLESSMMILDFDNGDLSIDDFNDIFWKKAGRGNKRSFLIFNSFSRSTEQPNRFRVIMLYKQPATSLEAHHAVYDSIVNRLELNGFDEDSSGLDRVCRNGVQSFYIPSTSAANPDWHYFKAYGCTTRDVERHAIDADKYLRTAIKTLPFPKVVKLGAKSKEIHHKSIQEWKTEINAMTSGRRATVFSFAVALATRHGCPRDQVESHLWSLATGDTKLDNHIVGALAALEKQDYWVKTA